MDLRRIILARYALLLVFVLLFSIAITGRIVYIQISGADKWEDKLQSLENHTEKIHGSRGNIYSTDGRLLATSLPFYEIRFDLGCAGVKEVFLAQVKDLSNELTKIFTDRTASRFESELRQAYNNGRRYYLVHPRKVNYDELQRIKDFPIFKRGKYRGGFIAEQQYIRFTPHGNLAYRTIGLMNKGAYGGVHGSIGVSGIEAGYEGYLRGGEGLVVRQNLSGRWVNVSKEEPENGKDVITTIDIYLQDVVENALLKQLVKSDAEYGTAVLMEVNTGKIRAIANLGKSSNGYSEIYNYAIGHEGSSEPGSTFKLISMMVALEGAKVDTSDVFDVGDGKWKIYDKTIYDSDYGYAHHGELTVKQIFEKSSNVGVAKIIDAYYKNREKEFVDRLYNLGLNSSLNIGFRGEAVPYVKYPTDKNWWGTSLAYISHGYEMQMSPMHTLAFYNAVANNGKMMKPMFVEAVQQNGVIIKKMKPEVLRNSICSDETLGKLQSMLEGVVTNGTARSLQTSLYNFAGKTGTAKVLDMETGYLHRKYRASFAGYFPAEEPKYSCIVVISEPKGAFYGGSVAGPVFREIADCVFISDLSLGETKSKDDDENIQPPMLSGSAEQTRVLSERLNVDIPNFDSNIECVSVKNINKTLNVVPQKIEKLTMPNVLGMGVSDAIYYIEKAGMKVKIHGVGKVKKQFPSEGSKCRQNQLVYVDLS